MPGTSQSALACAASRSKAATGSGLPLAAATALGSAGNRETSRTKVARCMRPPPGDSTAPKRIKRRRGGGHDRLARRLHFRTAEEPLAQLIPRHSAVVLGLDATPYEARTVGEERADGMWEGWIEFQPLDSTGTVLSTDRETTQPNLDALAYWA